MGELVVVTGMTGAGRSTAAKELEDLGFYVVDNLPPTLLPDVVRLVDETRGTAQRCDLEPGVFTETIFARQLMDDLGLFAGIGLERIVRLGDIAVDAGFLQ